MIRPVNVAFASCNPDLMPGYVERFSSIHPDTELFVMSEFPPHKGRWIPYRIDHSFSENLQRARAALAGTTIRFAAAVHQPKAPYLRLWLMAWFFAPHRTLFYNHNLDHVMLRPRGVPALLRHFYWRIRERAGFELRPGGNLYTWLWRLRHPSHLRRPLAYGAARLMSPRPRGRMGPVSTVAEAMTPGVSVVIPTRNGRDLLERLLPRVVGQVAETIVVDNGSDDGTVDWLGGEYPTVRVEHSVSPLSFARAVNRGIAAARHSHVCLLNNDMEPEQGFFEALLAPFDSVPDLFCSTAQIFFPPGKRREETGKAVLRTPSGNRRTTEFPVYCDEPVPGEDGTYVLYGSGGCSLYETAKLRALGGVDEVYVPAYVEDLDLGVRGWQRGWPTVFAAGARTVHAHRATTSRYYGEEELRRVLERNYLLFVRRTVASPELWRDAVTRLNLMAALEQDAVAADVLVEAVRAALNPAWQPLPGPGGLPQLNDIAVFPGKAARQAGTIVAATCYSPFPLSHGGAVRMYNLMRRAAAEWSQVLVTFVDELHTPAPELLDICVEVVQVRRRGTHVLPNRGRPDAVEEFDSSHFGEVLRQTVRKWKPGVVQLEFTQMAQYARCCTPARTVLVEHDVTVDLYKQLLGTGEDYDLRRQLACWERFEKAAWREVDCVVTMSERDRSSVQGAREVEVLANGVDLVRYRRSEQVPEVSRLLFVGSFAHLPNLLGLDFFVREVWPRLGDAPPVLHVIAGSRHRYFFDRSHDRLGFSLDMPGLEVEDFVSDVRPAYGRATLVIAPLLASAGTNIKIMEAMAMGKAIVSTRAGINGLEDLTPGHDIVVEDDPERMAGEILALLANPRQRLEIEKNARQTAERVYDWDRIAAKQSELYRRLIRS